MGSSLLPALPTSALSSGIQKMAYSSHTLRKAYSWSIGSKPLPMEEMA